MANAEEHTSIQRAVARERELKRWSAKKKEALVVGDVAALKVLQTNGRSSTK